jgi:hypothetical protein
MKKLLFIAMLFACQLTFAQESMFIIDTMVVIENEQVLQVNKLDAVILENKDEVKLYISTTNKVLIYKYRYTNEDGKRLYSQDSEISELFNILTTNNLIIFHHIKSNILTVYSFGMSKTYNYEK